jgi:hypothetical protein
MTSIRSMDASSRRQPSRFDRFRPACGGYPGRVFGFDPVLAVVGGVLAVLALAAGMVYLRRLTLRRGRTGGKPDEQGS